MDAIISKTIFNPDFKSGEIAIVTREGEAKKGLIVKNLEDTLVVALLEDVLTQDGFQETEVFSTNVEINEVVQGLVSVDLIAEAKPEEEIPMDVPTVDKKALYDEYRAVSNMLCEEEHILAEANGIQNQEDIDGRHEARMEKFKSILLNDNMA